MIEIRAANFPDDLWVVQSLFKEYAESLGVDLGFQGFDAELSGLPGKYEPPDGRLLIAADSTGAAACIAMRRIDERSCEMKRLYVRPRARGENLGRRLVESICNEARNAGYSRICLDTLPSMAAAQALYASLGFVPIEPYVFNPIAGTKFMARDLNEKATV